MTKPTHPAKNRRSELIRIAFDRIAHRGFECLRVHDVASEAGINNATLHYYFPTKEDLIRGVVNTMMIQFSTSSFSTNPPKDRSDAWEEILADFEDAHHRPRKVQEQLIVYTELLLRSLHDSSTAVIFKRLDKSWRNFLIGVIETGMAEGIFRKDLDPKITATLIMIQNKGMGLQAFSEAGHEIQEDVFDQLVRQTRVWLSGDLGPRNPDPLRQKRE